MAGAHSSLTRLLLFCGVILLLTMPNVLSPGDGYGPRSVAAHLVMTGTLGIPYSERAKMDYVATKGEYFFENDDKQLLFSKWGIMDTILDLPAALAQRLYAGKVELVDLSTSYLVFVNLNYLLIALACIAYLYKITSFYEEDERVRFWFVAAMVFTTFLWHYLRSHMHELFQLVLFLGFIYHYLAFLRASAAGEERAGGRWTHLTWAAIWVGLLIHAKPNYLSIMATSWLFALLAGPAALSLRERVRRNLTVDRTRLLLHLILPTVGFVVLLLLLNDYRYGSPFENGYSQEEMSNPGEVGFSLAVLKESLPGFLFLPGNANIFLHFPLLLFALFGVRRFARKWPGEAAFLYFLVLSNFSIIACYETWRGEMTYGPRYLLLFAVIGTVPLLETVRWLRENRGRLLAKAFGGAIALAMLWSFVMQLCVNTVYNFTPQFHDAYFFRQFEVEEINRYHENYFTQGTFAAALLAYKFGWRGYYPLQVLEDVLKEGDPQWSEGNRRKLEDFMKWEVRINYFLLRPWLGAQDTTYFDDVNHGQ